MDWIRDLLNHFWIAYVVIFIFTALIYKIAFARRLPVLKAVIVYLFLGVGCYLFTIMHLFGFPIIPPLIGTVLLIVVARWRLDARSGRSQGE